MAELGLGHPARRQWTLISCPPIPEDDPAVLKWAATCGVKELVVALEMQPIG